MYTVHLPVHVAVGILFWQPISEIKYLGIFVYATNMYLKDTGNLSKIGLSKCGKLIIFGHIF